MKQNIEDSPVYSSLVFHEICVIYCTKNCTVMHSNHGSNCKCNGKLCFAEFPKTSLEKLNVNCSKTPHMRVVQFCVNMRLHDFILKNINPFKSVIISTSVIAVDPGTDKAGILVFSYVSKHLAQYEHKFI